VLERIIRSGTKEGDTVLDPFCGCGTTIAVAQRLKRRWIGIDITQAAIVVVKQRLADRLELQAGEDYEVNGESVSVSDAQVLASENPYQFQVVGSWTSRCPPRGREKRAPTGVSTGSSISETTQVRPSNRSYSPSRQAAPVSVMSESWPR
jgi:site-specific DNA-methyltransferase (adenine-specific)